MIRFIATIAFLVLVLTGVSRSQELPTASDKAEIIAVIEIQIQAFRRDDGLAAFSYASPGIQARFGSAKNFMASVIAAYQPHYRPRSLQFQDLLSLHGQPTQRVLLVGPDGIPVIALYSMAQMPDGSWRIDGCLLLAAESA